MLYQIDQTGAAGPDVFVEFWAGQVPAAAEVREFAERLVDGVLRRRSELDALIVEVADHWRLERMALVDRNVLRIAVFELLHEPTTPAVVAIDEAIEVSKRFGGQASASFVNGMLDAIRKRLALPPAGAAGDGRAE